MSKEAMKLALEALEAATRYGAGGFEDAKAALREALAEQPAQQEPVYHPRQYGDVTGTKEVRTLQTQRTWVGLTDAEVEDFVSALWPVGAGAGKLLRDIEVKLREKNNG